MYKLYLSKALVVAISFLPLLTDAQPAGAKPLKKSPVYVSLSCCAGAGLFFDGSPQGSLNLRFPYAVRSAPGGPSSDSVFQSKTIKPYSPLKVIAVPFTLEVGNKRQFGVFQFFFVFMGEWAGTHVLFGYGRNIPLHISSFELFLKPSLNLVCTEYRGYDSSSSFFLGSIDNANKYIDALGTTANPTYNISSHAPDYVAAKTLNVYYDQAERAMEPKLSIGSSPYLHRFFWLIDIGYIIPFIERGQIILTQDDVNRIQTKAIDDGRITATFDSGQIHTAPYKPSGLFVGATFGINFSPTLHW